MRVFSNRRIVSPLLAWLAFWFLVGCDKEESLAPKKPTASANSKAKNEEQSPNARILPEPLVETDPEGSESVEGDFEIALAKPAPRVRTKPRPWPLRKPLSEDLSEAAPGSGYRVSARFNWPDVEREIQHEKKRIPLWPAVDVELLRESSTSTARLRWIHSSPLFALPQGAELRMRADRLGTLILWANRRSYRLATEGALRALYSDRRVDRLPFLEARMTELGGGTVLGRKTSKKKLVTSLGTAVVQMTELNDLPLGSTLLCRLLLEFIRVRADKELCPEGQLPLRFTIDWNEGGEMDFEVVSLTADGALDRDAFRTPPPLPIHKPGELPPMDGHPLRVGIRRKIFSLGERSKTELPVEKDASEVEPNQSSSPVLSPPKVRTRPANEVVVVNASNRRLLLILDGLPYFWLEPAERRNLYLSQEEIRLNARDFLGETKFDQRLMKAPGDVVFGAETKVLAEPN